MSKSGAAEMPISRTKLMHVRVLIRFHLAQSALAEKGSPAASWRGRI